MNATTYRFRQKPQSKALLVVFFVTLIMVVVGLVLSFMRGPVYWLIRVYVDFIRGTPVLVLILASFYILGTVAGDDTLLVVAAERVGGKRVAQALSHLAGL